MPSIIQTISTDELTNIVKDSFTLSEVLKKLNLSGRGHSYDYLKERLSKDNIDYTHFIPPKRVKYDSIDDIFKVNSTFQNTSKLKKKLFDNKLKENKCDLCNQLPFHNGKSLVLQLDHKNGNNTDNSLENLRILCPNCHSQTHTYSGGNKNKREKIYCKTCNKPIGITKHGYCKKCFLESKCGKKYKEHITQNQPKKFEVSKEKLEQMIRQYPMTTIGKMFGVSDNSIRKRCKNFGIDFKKKRSIMKQEDN